ncbi:hypothetical protein C0581_02275 [Candidatus Parcubacteria bacterium]|nr:MAG: hypothetical protein C0581_02275 [Candidatus Parcubacteria bacterium]
MNIIYLDTETTDANPDARLVQLAYKDAGTGEEVNEYFKPPVSISFGAMAVHHITEKMVEDKPEFEGSDQKNKLISIIDDSIVVAHNALFDIGILKNEGVETKEYIDTLRVARHVMDSESYGLQYLRYSLGFDIEAAAHDAWGDILVLESLFEYIKVQIAEKYSLSDEAGIIEKMIELTHMPVMLPEFLFGKHRGKTFEAVAKEDQGYLEWLYNSETSKEKWDQNEDLVYTLKNYINKM